MPQLLPERLPAPLSQRIASASAAIYNRQGREVDIAIGGIPFRLADDMNNPYTIETIPVRKDQADVEQDPGEQSLSGWWRRAQASFHEGAGSLYQEDPASNQASANFWDSRGIDVFSKRGEAKPVRAMVDLGITGATFVSSGYSHFYVGTGTNVTSYSNASPPASVATMAPHSTGGHLVDFVETGSSSPKAWGLDDGGFVVKYNALTGAVVNYWSLGSWTFVAGARIYWGKHRLWVINGASIWAIDQTAASATAQAPFYTNPDTDWTYTCVTEGPAAMYFGGYSGTHSSIQSVSLDSNGGLPSLSGAAITGLMPDGELVQALAMGGGSYIGIGTSRGVRVGKFNSLYGHLEFGPLIVGQYNSTTACKAMVAQGRFFVASFADAVDDTIAYRVDSGLEFQDATFPFAPDIQCGTTAGVEIASIGTSWAGGSLVAVTTDGHAWYQSQTAYVNGGWLQTGRIRFRTNEMKAFKYATVETNAVGGGSPSITVTVLQDSAGSLTLGSAPTAQTSPFRIDLPPMRSLSVKFAFNTDLSDKAIPILNSYLVKALPSVAPQRMITLPLLCYDQEQSRSGQRYGGDGYARDRLTALQLLEDSADTLSFQDFSMVTSSGRLVVIEGVKFTQTSPAPLPTSRSQGPGGVLLVQLRTVDQ